MPGTRRLRTLGETLERCDANLILIGGIGTPPVDKWAIHKSWRNFLETTGATVQFLAFDHQIPVDNTFSLQTLIEEGQTLIECLADHQRSQEKPRPSLFMCQSLGCFILEQALCIANAQNQKYALVLHSILAIIFLGGPNATSANSTPMFTESVSLILRSVNNKISKQCHNRLKADIHMLADISRLFQDIQLNHVGILSLFESKKTKVKIGRKEGRIFSSSQKLILVDKSLAATGVRGERQWELRGDHATLCDLEHPDGGPDPELKQWLLFKLSKESLEAAAHRINSAMIPDSPAVSLTSLSSYDAARIALMGATPVSTATPSRSNDPTAGSSTGKSWELVPIINAFSSPRRTARLPCFMVETPVRNKDFFGREEVLGELDEWLVRSDLDNSTFSSQPSSKRHVVLCGMGGIGKTSIAIEFAFSRRDKFDAVFWIRADEPPKLEQDFAQIASRLELKDPSEHSNPVISRELAMGWLTNPKKVLNQDSDIIGQAEARWLLIFDNADTPESLQDYWPLSGNGSILVTSRDPLSKTSPSIACKSIDLTPLDDNEAANLLKQLSGNSGEEVSAMRIARQLGGLPLAISQMAAIIRYQYLTFSDFLEKYEDDAKRKRLHAYESMGAKRQEARGSIASIWAVEQLDQGAKALIQLFAVLDPDCIQEPICEEYALATKYVKDFPEDWMAYSAARAELLKRSLITRNVEKKELWIHRVLQDSVKSQMSDERLLVVYTAAVALITAAWGPTSLEKRHVLSLSKSREGLFPHAMILRGMYERLYKESNPQVGVDVAVLMNEAGWWQHERGSSHESKAFWQLALEICERNHGPQIDQLLADVHYGLSAAANETNDATSCLHHTQLLLAMRIKAAEENGNPDLRLAIAHNESGIAWIMNGEYRNGIAAFKRSIEIYRSLQEYWISMDTNPRTNLGFTYWVMGDIENASSTLEELLRDRELRFGVNDTESYRTGRVIHGIGNIRNDQGRLDESKELHQRALAHYQLTLGNNHHKTADLCHRVAQHCLRNGELDNARTLINQALRIWKLKPIVFSPEIARTTFLKALLYTKCGDDKAARDHFREARNLRNSIPKARPKADVSLTEADFDELVTFFSR